MYPVTLEAHVYIYAHILTHMYTHILMNTQTQTCAHIERHTIHKCVYINDFYVTKCLIQMVIINTNINPINTLGTLTIECLHTAQNISFMQYEILA